MGEDGAEVSRVLVQLARRGEAPEIESEVRHQDRVPGLGVIGARAHELVETRVRRGRAVAVDVEHPATARQQHDGAARTSLRSKRDGPHRDVGTRRNVDGLVLCARGGGREERPREGGGDKDGVPPGHRY